MEIIVSENRSKKGIELTINKSKAESFDFQLIKDNGYKFNKESKVWFKPNAYFQETVDFINKIASEQKKKGKETKKPNKPKAKPTPKKEKSLSGIPGTLSLSDIGQRPFSPYKMNENWETVIGHFELPINILVYGKGGRGKSGMALSFANDFSKGGKRVLYASKEQFYSPTLPHLVRSVGIDTNNKNITFSPEFETENYNPSMFDLVILDSKDSFKITDPVDFENLVRKYPKTSFVLLSQSTKDDEFRGAGNWQNVVDTMLHVYEKGKMRTGEKNRWGANGEITLFESE